MDISTVAAQASAADAGELFVYALDQPLTLPRGEAAMVPIVSRDVAGDALTIVNNFGNKGEQVAQNGFRLKNDSDLRLSGGPITVYSGGIYGGDARLEGLSPRASKLIAYGIDLDLVVKREADETSTLFADNFHSDWSFLAQPPAGTLLFGNVIPPVGGDTLFANQYDAWDALAPSMKALLEGSSAVASPAAMAAACSWLYSST